MTFENMSATALLESGVAADDPDGADGFLFAPDPAAGFGFALPLFL